MCIRDRDALVRRHGWRAPKALISLFDPQCKPGPAGPDRSPRVLRPALLTAGGGDLRGDFVREVVDLLLDAFADDVEREALDRRAGGLEHLLDGLLVVLHAR